MNRIVHLACSMVTVGLLSSFALAATINVTTTDDSGAGSLRQAITDANGMSGSDTIELPAGTYTLAGQLPEVRSTIIINGAGAIIEANAAPATATFRMLAISGGSGAKLTLNNLTLRNGNCPNESTCTDPSDSSSRGDGGAIYNKGELTLVSCTVSNNTATNKGGAIYNRSALIITDSMVNNNTSGSSGGGAIGDGVGTITITGSTFMANTARSGGGILSTAPLTITSSTFSGNSAMGTSGYGGAVLSGHELTVQTSTFDTNTSARGGAIYSTGGTSSSITNSTFYSNMSTTRGGGVYNDANLAIRNSTFTLNSATTDGGGLFSDPYQDDPVFAVVTIDNSIFANSPSGGDCFNKVNGAPHPFTGQNNLIETDGTSPCGTTSPIAADPMLGTLEGTPGFYPLLVGSPAMDAGDNTICAASPVSNASQNGVTRPFGMACDIGSYEYAVPDACTDTNEPNDTTATATAISCDNFTQIRSCIGNASDVDFYRFSGTSGQILNVAARAEFITPASSLDAEIRLYDSTPTLVATSSEISTDLRDPRLSKLLTTGDYYLEVRTEMATVGEYDVSAFCRTVGMPVTFSDVPPSHPFASFVGPFSAAGITGGCSATEFCPDTNVTRGQMAVFIVRALGFSADTGGSPRFTDVSPAHAFYGFIQKFADLGITGGCSLTTFCPDDTVTRGQMAVFLNRALGIGVRADLGPSFSDVPSTHTFYGWIEAFFSQSITGGCGTGTYCPDSPVTRGQMAVFITRAFGLNTTAISDAEWHMAEGQFVKEELVENPNNELLTVREGSSARGRRLR